MTEYFINMFFCNISCKPSNMNTKWFWSRRWCTFSLLPNWFRSWTRWMWTRTWWTRTRFYFLFIFCVFFITSSTSFFWFRAFFSCFRFCATSFASWTIPFFSSISITTGWTRWWTGWRWRWTWRTWTWIAIWRTIRWTEIKFMKKVWLCWNYTFYM